MRKLVPGVAVSVIVHAGLLAYVAQLAVPRARRDEAAPTVTIEVRTVHPVEPPAAPAMAVALLDDTLPAVPGRPARAPAITAPIAPQVASLPAAPPPTASPPAASPPAMRHAPILAPPAGVLAEIAAAPPRTPAADPRAGPLDNAVVPGRFDVKVAGDGTVTLTDKPNVRLGLPLQQALDDFLHGDNTLGGPRGDPAIAPAYQPAPGTAVVLGTSSSINAVSSAMSHNVDGKGTVIVLPLIGGSFDATDALLRGRGGDPYFAHKLKVLDATRDERGALRNLNRAEQLTHATALMQRNLDALWGNPRLDLAAKRRGLFELWDECAEDGDPLLVDGARDARRLVIAFIRGHLPAGGPGAYAPAELAALARHQQSRAVFDPYAE